MNYVMKSIIEAYSCMYFKPYEYKKVKIEQKKHRKVEPVSESGKGGIIDVRV